MSKSRRHRGKYEQAFQDDKVDPWEELHLRLEHERRVERQAARPLPSRTREELMAMAKAELKKRY